jgi:hypothetical protein
MRIRYLLLLGTVGVVVLLWLCAFVAALARGRRVSKCPSCHSDRIRPSWPTIRDKILRVSRITPYRCEACLKRFYVRAERVYTWPGVATNR